MRPAEFWDVYMAIKSSHDEDAELQRRWEASLQGVKYKGPVDVDAAKEPEQGEL